MIDDGMCCGPTVTAMFSLGAHSTFLYYPDAREQKVIFDGVSRFIKRFVFVYAFDANYRKTFFLGTRTKMFVYAAQKPFDAVELTWRSFVVEMGDSPSFSWPACRAGRRWWYR